MLGSVENMAYLVCPHCGEQIEVFHRGRVSRPVDAGGDGAIPRLAEIPLDPVLSEAADTGRPVLVADLWRLPGSGICRPRQGNRLATRYAIAISKRIGTALASCLRSPPAHRAGYALGGHGRGIPVLLLSIRVPLLQGAAHRGSSPVQDSIG